MDIEKIQNKLKKLLALSASDNEAEASLAMAKCKELMEKYNIRTIDVDIDTNEANVSSTEVEGYSKKRSSWQVQLGAGIAQCFDGKAITTRYYAGGWKTTFIAGATEIVLIKDLYIRLRRVIGRMASVYASNNEGNTRSQKNNYAHGIVDRVYWRLKEIYKTMKDEDKALVLVKTDSIENLQSELFEDVTNENATRTIKDKNAYLQGMVDGDKVCLHKTLASENNRHLQEA